MSAPVNTRLLWLSVPIATCVIIATRLWFTTTTTASPCPAKSSANPELSSNAGPPIPPPSLTKPPPPQAHRPPEADVSLHALHTLLSHPNTSIRTATLRLILHRLTRHRLHTRLHTTPLHTPSYASALNNQADHMLVRDFYRAIDLLESFDWMGQSGGMPLNVLPAGVWGRVVRGYEGWQGEWEGRYGRRSGRGEARVDEDGAEVVMLRGS